MLDLQALIKGESFLRSSKKILRACCHAFIHSHLWFYGIVALYLIGTTNVEVRAALNWHDEQRLGAILFLALLFVGWCQVQARSKFTNVFISLIPAYVMGCVALFAVFGAISAAVSPFPHWAFLEWAWLLALLLGALFIANIRFDANQKFDYIVLGIIVTTCLVYLANFLADYVTRVAVAPLNALSMFYGFSNVRFFGQFQTMTLPLLAALIFYAKSTPRKIGAFALLGGWWMLSFVSGTRGTWLGMFAAIVAVLFFGKIAGWAWVKLQIGGMAIGLALYGFLFFDMHGGLGIKGALVSRLSDITGLSRRDVLWGRAWDMILTHPLLGAGPMQFATQPNGVGAHPHNAVLQIAAEWGVPALLLIGSLIVLALFRFAQDLHGRGREVSSQTMLQTALFGALVAAAVQSLVDGIIVMPYSQILLMLIAGWSIGLYYASPDRCTIKYISRSRPVGIALVSILLLGVIAWTIFPDVLHLQAREWAFQARHGNYFLPRFWRQGWIDQ